ncbi:MAG: Sensor histidine kinase RcsC [Ignavibacteriaceae bacterium]|nr:Sensor histidine kinase RcsC [Ignavibacteriaceae bacterium]
MIHKPPKLQLSLTIQFAVFFIIVAAFIYFYFSQKFEEEVLDKFMFKAEVITKFIEQNPDYFDSKIVTDKTEIIQLMALNEINYLVIENQKGELVDAVNLDLAEYYLYVSADKRDYISFDESIYKIVIPIRRDEIRIGKVYLGFNARKIASELRSKTLLTALFSLTILLAGMIFTYFLSSISFRPITKLISALSKSDIQEQKLLLSNFKNDEIGILAGRIYNILNELDKSSNEVENLNEKLKSLFREKIYELDVEISHRKKAEIFLKKTEEMFKILFESAPIGMLIVSNEGKVLKSNKAFCNTVGYDEFEVTRLHIKNFFDDSSMGNLKSTYHKIMESESLDLEAKLTKRSGRKLFTLLKSIKIRDEEGKPINTLLQVLDISEIKRVQGELELALEQAKESDRLKSAFLAQMSHEIRTPLNVILPSIPILADEIGEKDKEMVSILHAVDNAGKRLYRTIDMILSMSAVQSGNYKAKFEKINLAEDINNLTQEFTTICKDKGLEIYFDNKCKSSDISADRYTIGQVFQNLIGNAIKYTQKGKITVSIEDFEENKIIIRVADTGIGMSEKYQKNLFTPFSQEDAGQTRKYEGNGLGLALVKEYVILNKGQISVKSEKNKGSEFSVVFEKILIRVTAKDKNLMLDEV